MNAADVKAHCANALASNSNPDVLRLYGAAYDIFSQLEQLADGPSVAPVAVSPPCCRDYGPDIEGLRLEIEQLKAAVNKPGPKWLRLFGRR